MAIGYEIPDRDVVTASRTYNDNVKVKFGTLGADGEIYSDGTDMFLNQLSGGGIMVGLAGSPPSPDGVSFHIWKGSAGGALTANSLTGLVLESDLNIYLQFLTPNGKNHRILFTSSTAARAGYIDYALTSTPVLTFHIAAADRLAYSAGAFAFQEATTISTTAGNLTFDPTGIIVFNKTVDATASLFIRDGVRLGLGNAPDMVMINRGTILAADDLITNVILNTANHQGVAANSLVVSGITDDGDALFLVSDGGDSKEYLKADGDIATLTLGFAMERTIIPSRLNIGAAVSLIISSGAIAYTAPRHTLVVEGGTGSGADSLATATGGIDGDLLSLQIATSGASDTVTISDGTGNGTFILLGGADFAMDHVDDRIEFIHNGTEWVERTRSSNS